MNLKNEKYYTLTHAQKRIWYIEKIYNGSPLHNIGGYLKINGNAYFKLLEDSINYVIQKNEAFRLNFIEKNGQPYQYVHEFEYNNIEYFDFSNFEKPQQKFEQWCEETLNKSFSLEKGKLYYFAIYKVSDEHCGILLSIHHIISDGWSINLIQKQVCDFCNNNINGNYINYNVEYSYIDYIDKEKSYLESEKFYKNKGFWNEKFSNLPENFLYKGSDKLEGKRKVFNIDKDITDEIQNFVKNQGCSINTFFITSMLIYLYKTTGYNDITIGSPVFNRSGRKEKNTIGMFTSTMPFRFNINSESSVSQVIKDVTHELKYCFFNQRYPYNLLISDLQLSKRGYDGLFNLYVNYYNSGNKNYIGDIPVSIEELYSGNQNYSLQMIVKDWTSDNSLSLSFDYKISEYSEEDINKIYYHIINISKEMINNADGKIINLSLLDEEEQYNKIYRFNDNKAAYPKDKTIYELFEDQVRKTPSNSALYFENKILTYNELNEKSNQLAHYLRELGIKRGSIVGIMATHSFEIVISILAVLKAGAAYIPIDVNYPIGRINYMLLDSEASILITNVEIIDEINFAGRILNLNNKEIYSDNKRNLEKNNTENDLAYIIYTSGSTGKPKGVMIQHKGLVNYIYWAKKMYLKQQDDIFAFYSSISFDLTITSIFTPLISGNTMAIYYDDGEEFILYKIIKDNKATVIKLTPSHLTLIKDRDNRNLSIRRFVVGGENLKVSTAKEVYESFGGNIEIINEYGPTETVVGCMIYKYNVQNDKGISVPIGIPADNVQIYLLDKDLNIVPNGVEGEIYISGEGVARGYLNRDDLTDEKFISNPFISNQKMYKSGDIGIYLENGNIECLGRRDNQVKIRGHRIELGEIEKHLLQNKLVNDVVVIDKNAHNGDKVIYAYIIADNVIEVYELKKWLSKFIPQYMVPSFFIQVDEFPLTPNGKVDFNLLPTAKEEEKEFIKCENDMEKTLVDIMHEIMGFENISLNDNFYQLGGDSIKAIQISSKLNNIGLSLKVKDILAYDTIQEIASCIEISNKKYKINQGIYSGNIKNTPIIEWFLKQNFKEDYHFNQSVLLKAKDNINIDHIKIALKKLVEHHDMLRANYNKDAKELYYNNYHLDEDVNVYYYDLSNESYEVKLMKINDIGSKLKSSFDLRNSMLLKICVFDLGQNDQAILFTAHHLIIDGVSWRILLEDFNNIIKALKSEEPIYLPEKTNSFKDWALRLHEYSKDKIDQELEYWKSIESKKCTYALYSNEKNTKANETFTISGNISVDIINELNEKINEIYGMELGETLIAVLALTVKNIFNFDEVLFELEGHGREYISDEMDVSRTVGWFTTMYPVCIEVFEDNLDINIKVIKEQLRSIPNNGFNYSILKYINNRILSSKDENEYIRFNYLGDFNNILNSEIFSILDTDSGSDSGENNHLTALLDITAIKLNNNFKLSITYDTNKFGEQIIQEFVDNYIKTIYELLDFCNNKDEREFTPSDFDAVEISQEDLDMLFGDI